MTDTVNPSGENAGNPKPEALLVISPVTRLDGLSRFLRTPDAAAYLSLSPRTLEKHRTYGTGPAYRKLGGRVVYSVEDLDAWAAIGTRRSTSDLGAGTVHPAMPRAAHDARLVQPRRK